MDYIVPDIYLHPRKYFSRISTLLHIQPIHLIWWK